LLIVFRCLGPVHTEIQILKHSRVALCVFIKNSTHIQININNQVENKTPAQSTSSHIGNTPFGGLTAREREREKGAKGERNREREKECEFWLVYLVSLLMGTLLI